LLELNEVLDLTTLACQNITFDDCKDVLEFNLERNQIKERCDSVRRDKKNDKNSGVDLSHDNFKITFTLGISYCLKAA